MALPARLPDLDPPRDPRAVAREFHALAVERDLRPAAELIRPLQGRLEHALLSRFGPSIGGPAGAETIATQAMSDALLRADQFKPESGDLWPWLFRIGHNLAIDELTDARRARTRVGDDGIDVVLAGDAAESDRRHELSRLVRSGVRQMPKRARLLIWSRGRVPGQKLAQLFGCSVGQVYNQRSIVLSRLRELLERLVG